MAILKKITKAFEAQKKIVEASPEQSFWVHNGPVVKNLAELRDALESMDDDQFNYHTKRDGNDFARWIEDVLQNKQCAGKLKRMRSRKGAIGALEACVK